MLFRTKYNNRAHKYYSLTTMPIHAHAIKSQESTILTIAHAHAHAHATLSQGPFFTNTPLGPFEFCIRTPLIRNSAKDNFHEKKATDK